MLCNGTLYARVVSHAIGVSLLPRALPASAAPTQMCALTSAVGGPIALAGAATVTSAAGVARPGAIASPEPSPIAIDPCTVLGIVAHAVSVCIHKRATALGGPVTGGLRGPCGTAAQRIACAFQPCGTCTGPWAIYLGVIRGARLRIQATGRCGRRGASTSAHSLTGGHGTGCSHRNCGSKGHCSYQGDCRHVRVVTLMPSFHLAPLSTCLGRRLVLRGAFVPFTLNTSQGGISLHMILNIFDQPRKNEGNPKPWRSLQAKKRAHSRNEPAPPRPRAPTPQPKDRGADRFLVSQTSARESS